MSAPRALITNDDGIDSPGLWALARGAVEAGYDVVVAAPHTDASGVGGSVLSQSENYRTAAHPRTLPGLDGVPAYAVEGHPAFIVHAAGRGWLDPAPELVFSGINAGANVGRSVMHSGTVNAALTASLYGWYGLAVSLECPWPAPANAHWDTALHVLPEVLDLLHTRPPGTVLSLNVPDVPVDRLAELREARLSRFGLVHVRVEHQPGDGTGPDVLESSLTAPSEVPDPDSDVALLARGHPTVTALRAVADVPGLPLPRRQRSAG